MQRLRPILRVCSLLGWILPVACRSGSDHVIADPSSSASSATLIAQTSWSGDAVRGLSGLARDDHGRFFAVPERARHLVVFEMTARGPRMSGSPLPIIGASEQGMDLESIAWVGGATLAIGTERKRDHRPSDVILIAAIEADRVRVVRSIVLDWGLWGLSAPSNEGIEGLCASGGMLLAAGEITGEKDGRRYAPIATYDLLSGRWVGHRLWLTTDRGKISALACRIRDGGEDATGVGPRSEVRGLEILAIERDFGIGRILAFRVPTDGGPVEITPEVRVDLAPRFSVLPNFEGLAWIAGDEVLLVSDNDYHGVQGPAELVHLRLGSPDSDR